MHAPKGPEQIIDEVADPSYNTEIFLQDIESVDLETASKLCDALQDRAHEVGYKNKTLAVGGGDVYIAGLQLQLKLWKLTRILKPKTKIPSISGVDGMIRLTESTLANVQANRPVTGDIQSGLVQRLMPLINDTLDREGLPQ